MKKNEILDTSSLFIDLARDLDSSLTSETGKTLNIVEFIEQEVDLGIKLTRNQLLPLKICYGCKLDEVDLAVIDYWKTANKTTLLEIPKTPPQVMIMESGRRCLTEDTRIPLPSKNKDNYKNPVDYVTFKELAEIYYAGNPISSEVDIDLTIHRGVDIAKATKLFRYKTKELVSIVTEHSHITGTPEHRLYVKDKGWVCMGDIKKEDYLYLANEALTKVIKVQTKKLTSFTYVYDLHVPNGNWYIANDIKSSNSGKSTLAALIAAYEFYFMSKLENPQKHYGVATSTPIGILCLATTAEQARRNIFRQILQILRNSEYFMQLEKKKEIFLGKEEIAYESKGLYIQSGNSKSASQVGSTLKCFILDEASRFQDSEGSSNALELWSNIGISAAPFGAQAKLIAISSAWYEGDAIQKLYNSTKENPFAVGFKLVSWDLNTTINKENPLVAHEYLENPDKAALEYEGVRPAAVDAFLDAYQIRRAITGYSVLKVNSYSSMESGISLVKLGIDKIDKRLLNDSILHVDPAIKGDSYGLALGHSEFNEDGEQIVFIDAILAWQPQNRQEVSISNVGEIIRTINVHRPLAKVTADHYNSAETIQRLRQDGILAEIVYFSNRQQLMMYSRLKTLLAEDRLVLPKDSPWTDLMYRELTQVQLINNKKIDHPKDNNGCFVGTTLIPLIDGNLVPIADLVDREVLVYSCDSKGNHKIGKAKGRLSKYINKLIELELTTGAVIICTLDHRFMLEDGTYMPAAHLVPYITNLMKIREPYLKNTKSISIRVKSKRLINLDKLVPVYDLEVDRWSNFALGAGIYVHNSKDIADAIASVAYELSERVTIDYSKPSTNIGYLSYLAGNNISMDSLTPRQKALGKLGMRRKWAAEELAYLKNSKNFRPGRDHPLI